MTELEKLDLLKDYLKSLGSVAVAYSSGVDSTFLLKAARDVLGDKAMAITAYSGLFPHHELEESKRFCAEQGIRQIIFDPEEMSIEGFAQNPPDRCYICKKALFSKIKSIAAENGMAYVAEGSNMDDMGDYRPGMRAIAELEITSPLRQAKLTKAEIRSLSHQMGLKTWSKPSYACLASRFAYGETITKEKLAMVEQAESFLTSLGFGQMRVRIHGMMARIELLPEEMPRFFEGSIRAQVQDRLSELGFSYVTLDLKGYRTGSMNEVL